MVHLARQQVAFDHLAAQLQLGLDHRGEVGENVAFPLGPFARLGVDAAERSQRLPVLVADRHAEIGGHAEVLDRAVGAQQRMPARVGNRQGRVGRDDVLAQRMGQRRFGQVLVHALARGKDLPLAVNEGHQCDRRTRGLRGQVRQPVQRLGGKVRAHPADRVQRVQAERILQPLPVIGRKFDGKSAKGHTGRIQSHVAALLRVRETGKGRG